VFSTFFRLGQTIETFRGKGVNQPAVDLAIEKLDQGGWVHLYGEGKVNQPKELPRDDHGVAHLPRFKWGVGRILMETAKPPVVIPVWLTGFDTLMPEGRAFPYKYFPRPGAKLSVTFGDPIPADVIQKALGNLGDGQTDKLEAVARPPLPKGWIRDQITSKLGDKGAIDNADERTKDILKIRSEVTAIIRDSVEALGRSICGDTLSRTQKK